MKYSIILPIYKVEKYLEECIESLLVQTYSNYEIILVDDGSPDNCPKICDDYARKNNSIKVIHKENGGLSDARNAGIKESTGDYLVFVDPDDYINSSHFLENINNTITKDQCDLVVFGYIKFYEKSKREVPKGKFIIGNHGIMESLIECNYYKASACDKVIKRNIVVDNNIYFPKGKVGEDIEWCAEVLKHINYDKVSVINVNYYMYRQREGSICRTLKGEDLEFIMDMFDKEKCNGNDRKSMVVNSYLANEYIIRLGRINSKEVTAVTDKIKNRYYNNKDLLRYNLSKKVKKVNLLIKLIGIKNASKILGKYIDIKNNK